MLGKTFYDGTSVITLRLAHKPLTWHNKMSVRENNEVIAFFCFLKFNKKRNKESEILNFAKGLLFSFKHSHRIAYKNILI